MLYFVVAVKSGEIVLSFAQYALPIYQSISIRLYYKDDPQQIIFNLIRKKLQ